MKVRDVIKTDVVTCGPETKVSDVARMLRENGVSGMPVVEDGKVVGIVSEADVLDLIDERQEDENIWLPSPFEAIEIPLRSFSLRDWLESHDVIERAIKDIGEMPVREIMTKNVKKTRPNDDIEEAANLMVRHNVNRLPVVEDGELVGLITRGDVLRAVSG